MILRWLQSAYHHLIHQDENQWPDVPADVARKRSRILVIDDAAFPYQKLFSRDGYSVAKWNDIRDLNQIERGEFDIILLDIHGVGLRDSADQGLGVLRHIRTACPAQLVIAYSGADFSLRYQEFFDMADARLAKTDDYVKFKEKVDELLKERFSLQHYVKRADRLLQLRGVAGKEYEPAIIEAILSKNPNLLRTKLSNNPKVSAESTATILSIVDSAISILVSLKTGA